MRRHLVIGAWWTNVAPDEATRAVRSGPRCERSGAVVAIEESHVDDSLRAFLRSCQLEEAADWRPDE